MIAIINCGANINSILFALNRLGKAAVLTDDPELIIKASHVILPGVGAAPAAMATLKQADLLPIIPALTQPVLGICLGMQLLYESSAEGEVSVLNIAPGKVQRLRPQPAAVIPHMGWNQLDFQSDSPLLKGINQGSYVYFTHSYAAPINEATVAVTDYYQPFTALMQWRNFFGAQFHPEKSGEVGSRILENFLGL